MDAPAAFSVAQFCEAHGISRGLFYRLLKLGDGPDVMKVGDRLLISTEAAEAWRRKMTQRTAARLQAA